MTSFPDLFAALAAVFESSEVRVRKQAGHELRYITARTAMNRLDSVLGPENWWDEYEPRENSVICRLSIRLPDGSTLTKCDAGGYAGMADSGDDDKSGFSDAFKRAAVKFGIGRYLYRDGVPSFGPAPLPPAVAELVALAQGDERLATYLAEWGRRKGVTDPLADWPEALALEAITAARKALAKAKTSETTTARR